MFFISKFVIIILLNKTYAHLTRDMETILLPTLSPTGVKEISITLKVFGRLIQLNLHGSDRVVPPAFEGWKYNVKNVTEKLLELNVSSHCYYYHEDHISSAAIDFCHEHGLEGLVFMENNTIEIRPLRNEFTPMCLIGDFRGQSNLSFGKSYVIKRSLQYFADSKLYHRDMFKLKRRHVRNARQNLTIELAVFFDEAAYHMYMPILDNDEDKLRNMILAYVNQIQALLHHSSFGAPVDISLVKLVIMDKQLSNLSAFDGDHKKMINSFCDYVNFLYSEYGIDSLQWDIGLYLTGINLYESEKEQKHYGVVGSSFFNSSCTQNSSCALVEIGSTGPYAVLGFATSRIAAHEIGHLLGMEHDNGSIDSTCPNGKYIMSDWQYLRGQVTWSACSRNITKNLWKEKPCLFDHTRREETDDPYVLGHSRYHNLPGREWTAKAQCELFLRDKDANVVTLHDVCQVLQCETPDRNRNFFAGPALDGTNCALGKECRGGECMAVITPPYIFSYCEDDNWSEWKEDSCKSNCLTKSKGVVIKRRFCKHGIYKTASCDGPYYDVVLCNDSSLCTEERFTIAEYTALKCTELSLKIKRQGKEYFKYEPLNEPGKQASHVVEEPWRACTIHCLREEEISANYSLFFSYAPRQEMLDLKIEPYFPDGTWCHEKDGQNYYCRQHYCLPENNSIEE
ncbi:A disintegrin and metalloproteinase with thrombospondin motifs adt-2-like [Linepithema humile]|uniref:A disintegrin and metalloproteinase with thrombospondin motifs adt-2-like n=1 Tax=Linepithema humile TaxID=83485 RepID=UPI00351E5338